MATAITRIIFPLALLAFTLVACGPALRIANPLNARGAPLATASTCVATDQDQYVYRPARLQVIAACVRVVGTVVSSSAEADGDLHINVRVDPESADLLTAANAEEDGNLVVEPVCLFPPVQAEAIRVCAGDVDPLAGPMPGVGARVVLEGRYVLDLQHHGWAELHPLYRWSTAP